MRGLAPGKAPIAIGLPLASQAEAMSGPCD